MLLKLPINVLVAKFSAISLLERLISEGACSLGTTLILKVSSIV